MIPFTFSKQKTSTITFLDVGQGDAAVIESTDGRAVIIDTGHTGREVLQYLRYRGVKEVSAIILSHGGRDHSGGFWNLAQSFPVREVWDNGLIIYSPPLKSTVIHRSLRAGDTISMGTSQFLVLHPHREYYSLSGDEENNNSLVVRFQDDNLSALFTGDVEADAENATLSLRKFMKSDVLKVAHHGSYTSSTLGFLQSTDPSVAVISVGEDNPYGHPHRSVMKSLERFRLFRTDKDGALRVFINGENELEIRKYINYLPKETTFFGIKEEIQNIKKLFLLW
jgi:competence protein ComEC